MSAEEQTPNMDLRRLGFVAVYSETILGKTYSCADQLYQAVRVHTPLPGFVDDRVKKAESKFNELSTPALTYIQTRATEILAIVDTKVSLFWTHPSRPRRSFAGRSPRIHV